MEDRKITKSMTHARETQSRAVFSKDVPSDMTIDDPAASLPSSIFQNDLQTPLTKLYESDERAILQA